MIGAVFFYGVIDFFIFVLVNWRGLFVVVMFWPTMALSQVEWGATGMYNLQSESFGLGMRCVFRPHKKIQIVPQASYFFAFNKVHEWTFGAAINAQLLSKGRWSSYSIIHGGFNQWMSYQNSKLKNARLNNWNAEIGAGVSRGKSVKLFLEWRYNIKFQEAHLQLGFLFSPKLGSTKKEKCAAYN